MLRIYYPNLKFEDEDTKGKWIEYPTSLSTFSKLENAYKDPSNLEIGKYETDIPNLNPYQYELDTLDDIAETWELLDERQLEVVDALLREGYPFYKAVSLKDDCNIYYDCYDMADVAEQYIAESGLLHEIPDFLQPYFDYEAYGRDMEHDAEYIFIGNKCIEVPC